MGRTGVMVHVFYGFGKGRVTVIPVQKESNVCASCVPDPTGTLPPSRVFSTNPMNPANVNRLDSQGIM